MTALPVDTVAYYAVPRRHRGFDRLLFVLKPTLNAETHFYFLDAECVTVSFMFGNGVLFLLKRYSSIV